MLLNILRFHTYNTQAFGFYQPFGALVAGVSWQKLDLSRGENIHSIDALGMLAPEPRAEMGKQAAAEIAGQRIWAGEIASWSEVLKLAFKNQVQAFTFREQVCYDAVKAYPIACGARAPEFHEAFTLEVHDDESHRL